MTEEIIVDGIDVSKCEHFYSSCKVDYSGEYLYKNVCSNHGFHDCDKKPCAFKCIEYQKQLKRKEQECEELKKKKEENEKFYLTRYVNKDSRCLELEHERNKYKQALDEITYQVTELFLGVENKDRAYCEKILSIINKAKEK